MNSESAGIGLPNDYLPVPEAKLTPLFRQYLDIKRKHPDCVLMYRLGDFYEMFAQDAEEASGVLGVVLTSRQITNGLKVSMCGIPHHSLMRYVKKLVDAGYKVALCDQLEKPDPKKKLVERGVTRIITAGTLVEDEFLSEDSEVFLMTLAECRGEVGMCLLEASGGRVGYTRSFSLRKSRLPESLKALLTQITLIRPQEVLIDEILLKEQDISDFFKEHPLIVKHTFKKEIGEKDAEFFLKGFLGTDFLESQGLAGAPAVQIAIFYLVKYLRDIFKVDAPKLFFQRIHPGSRLILDERALRHLEIFEPLEAGKGANSEVANGLYGILDKTRTPLGKRLLKSRLKEPFADPETITNYLLAVEELVDTPEVADKLRNLLENLPDSERILNRIILNRTNCAEVARLKFTLSAVPPMKSVLSECKSLLLNRTLAERLVPLPDLTHLLENSLCDNPPVSLSDGGVIRQGYSTELDRIRRIIEEGESWFREFEEKERKRTGIRTLKVKRTNAFGWFIEVTKSFLSLIPSDYERRQTLVGSERYVTNELKEREAEILTAKERALEIENKLFEEVLERVKAEADTLNSVNECIAEVDYLVSLAKVAKEEGWIKPSISPEGVIDIKGGVHPLVQRTVGSQKYVANDAYLDGENVQLNLITGPNMGGKSTYMRMVAIILILAHMGSFVPAESARIGICDRIFTRIGATDALLSGKSTFMVEMVETAEILNSATSNSLIILDEIGRGTSTYDGISIARAVAEYLHEGKRGRPKTLFATHYFELTELSEILPRIRNLKVDVRTVEGELVFLYKVLPGFVDESYGVEVARLAGLPKEVVMRARTILQELEEVRLQSLEKSRKIMQLGLFKSAER